MYFLVEIRQQTLNCLALIYCWRATFRAKFIIIRGDDSPSISIEYIPLFHVVLNVNA